MKTVPMILLLDVSSSMSGQRISQLKKGVKVFVKEVKKIARKKDLDCYVSIIQFNSDVYYQNGCSEENWMPLKKVKTSIIRNPNGTTHLGCAIIEAIHSMNKKLEDYWNADVTPKHPTLIIFTDGLPCGEPKEKIEEAIKLMEKYKNGWNVLTIACGIKNNEYLKKLSELNSGFNNGEVIIAENAKDIVACLKFASSSLTTEKILNTNIDIGEAYE